VDRRNLGFSALFARGSNAVAAGTTAINGASFDILQAGGLFDSFLAIAALGTLSATQVTTLKIQGSVDGSTNWTDLANTHQGPPADADSNKLLIVDIFRPQGFRYLRGVVTRGTANAVLDSLIYVGYNSHSVPINVQDSTVSITTSSGGSATPIPVNVVAYPAAGTA
jgi:hypothetical protein